MEFLTRLCLIPIDDTFDWYLEEQFIVRDEVLGLITIPANFRTDLGSIPRIFWNVVPPDGPAVKAYVVHDWLYGSQPCTRAQADDFALRCMKQLSVGWMARYTVYNVLRPTGWVAWNSDAKAGGPKFYVPK